VVLYGCETWSLALREQHRLKAIEKSVLRRIFVLKRDEMIGWRKPHEEELHNLYSYPTPPNPPHHHHHLQEIMSSHLAMGHRILRYPLGL
jgi:hypothetical protein